MLTETIKTHMLCYQEGQIIGIAVTKGSATDYHAYLATPSRD